MLERKDIMGRFDKEGSQEYDSQIKKFIPGYKLLHQLSAAYLKTTLNTNAKILVVGAGTGSDILELAKIDPTWRFTALDISKEMLDTAKIRFTEADIIARINFHVGEIDTLTEKEYDVAVCLLVTQFIKGHDKKINLLSSIASKLKKGSSLLLADLMQSRNEIERLTQGTISRYLGLAYEQSLIMLKCLENDFYPLNETGLDNIANSSGYDKPIKYFQSFRFCGFVLNKKNT
jgi:tRNA (cmo5U34)-methyltransferase